MSTSVKWWILSLPKQIPVQLLLSKATSNHFFNSQMKKNLSKTITTKPYPAKECEKKSKEECIKNECLSDYIYSIANL